MSTRQDPVGRPSRSARVRVIALVLTVGIASVLLGACQDLDPPLLPDLRQAPVGCAPATTIAPGSCTAWDVCPVADPQNPHAPCVTSGPMRQVRLRFTSSEENVGDGPLLLYGHRDSTDSKTMSVKQAIQPGYDEPLPDSFATAQQALPGASMYYEPALMHQHWHLLAFDRFQLVAADGRTVVSDRKNGFCLGDRYTVSDSDQLGYAVTDNGSPQDVLGNALAANNCKMHDPQALDVAEGISVGSGDNYDYTVDFQWLDVTRVPSGIYTLVNTVNPDRQIQEKDYANDSSAIAISLRWPGGGAAPEKVTAPPEVHLLRSCPGHDTCTATDAS